MRNSKYRRAVMRIKEFILLFAICYCFRYLLLILDIMAITSVLDLSIISVLVFDLSCYSLKYPVVSVIV